MAHGVDPAVKEVETPDLQAIRDRARIETERQDLRPSDDTMLPRRQFSQRNVGCAMLTPIIRLNTAHPVYVGAPSGPNGTPPPFRHTLNAPFVTKRRNRPRIQLVWDTA